VEEVDKRCSEFCDQNCHILIHSRLKALAVNLGQPSGRLWLYAGLIETTNLAASKQTLSVRILLLPHGFERVDVSSGVGLPG